MPRRHLPHTTILMMGLMLAGNAIAQNGTIAFQGAVMSPTLSLPLVAHPADHEPKTMLKQTHVTRDQALPRLLAYALNRAPNHPVELTTVTYL